MSRLPWIAVVIALGSSACATAQEVTLSTVPTQAVYEYQLNYQLPWQRYYGGPGLSIGGTMPTQGAFGYSTLNGIPFPAPLGAGVYVNAPGRPVPQGGLPFGPGPLMPGMGPPASAMGPASQNLPTSGVAPSRGRPRQATVSPPGARRSSLEQQNLGDAKLREQAWGQAYVHYRNAVDLAPERAEAHFRLGLSFTALKQYSSAIREFKRSLDLDATLPQSGEMLTTIFGDENKAMQNRVLPTVANWAQEDLRDSDRLFLLGLLLHFNNDPRGSEILESISRTSGPNDYIASFLTPAPGRPDRRRANSGPRRSSAPQSDRDAENSEPTDLPPAPAPELFPPAGPFPEPPPT